MVEYAVSRILFCWKSVWGIMREDLQENRECGMLGNLRDYKKAPSDLMGGFHISFHWAQLCS